MIRKNLKKEFSDKYNKVLRVSTVAFFVDTQLNSQIKKMVSSGLNVSVVTSDIELGKPIEGVDYYSISIARNISLLKDMRSLIILYNLFRKNKYGIVHSTTPKAGLLCAVAGKLAGVPIRIHTFTGQPWVTLSGFKREIVKLSDKVIACNTTACYTDSHSQKEFLVSEGIIRSNKISVVGKGSLAGVDLKRFNLENYSCESRKLIKKNLGIPDDATVLLFIGRITRDKGVFELIEAFNNITSKNAGLFLLMVGPQELAEDNRGPKFFDSLNSNIIFTGYTDEPEKYMAISDVLCLPSYREGFGTVVIEAAAMGLPAIGTNIYGLSDAIVDGETGVLVKVKSVVELTLAIEKLISDNKYLKELGFNAKKRALEFFSSDKVNNLVVDEYLYFLNKLRS